MGSGSHADGPGSGARRLRERIQASLRRESIVAFGRTAPNPAVAAVVVARNHHGEVQIFSGGTEPAGRRHAEIVAFDSLDSFDEFTRASNTPDALAFTARRIYVTLEPCSHHGRTPPCTTRILKYPELNYVVIYTPDPSLPESGCDILRNHGRRAMIRNNATQPRYGEAFLSGFLSRVAGCGPRLHFKAAVTSDGFLGVRDRRLSISGPTAFAVGQFLRAKLDAVLVGPGTIQTDLPALVLRPRQLHAMTSVRRTAGRDVFYDALYAEETAVRAAIQNASAEYQPLRVFILGRPFERAAEFLTAQAQLTAATGRAPAFAVLPGHFDAWRRLIDRAEFDRDETSIASDAHGIGLKQLPTLDDPNFAPITRAYLGQLGCNEVLVEGGARLFRALQSDARPQDRTYLLRSDRSLAEILHGAGQDISAEGSDGSGALAASDSSGVVAPEWLSAAAPLATYDLGGDLLEVRPARD